MVEETKGQYVKEIGGGYRGTERKRDWWRIQRASKENRLVEDTEGQ